MGIYQIVIEGKKASEIHELLCRAKEECGREECGYRSEIISTRSGQYCFAFGLEEVVKYESDDDIFGPRTVTTIVRPDVFMLLPDPSDESIRNIIQAGKIKFEYTDSILKVTEDTYADEGKGSTSVWTTRTCFCRRFKEFP